MTSKTKPIKKITGKVVRGKFVPTKQFQTAILKLQRRTSKSIELANKQKTLKAKRAIIAKVKEDVRKVEKRFGI